MRKPEVAIELPPRHEAFVNAYLGKANLNATAAAKMAGYSDKSDESLAVQGARLLINAKVRSKIRAHFEADGIERQDVLNRIKMLAGSDLADLMEPHQHGDEVTLALDMNAAMERGAIGIIREYYEGTDPLGKPFQRVKLHDPARYLEILAKHLGIVGDGAATVNINNQTAVARRWTDEELIAYYREQGWDLPDELSAGGGGKRDKGGDA